MKPYTVLFAEDVPHYGTVEIDAADDAAALREAMVLDVSEVVYEPEWENSVCKRIVHIEDASGTTIHHDVPLDDCVLRRGSEKELQIWDAATDMLEALRLCEEVLSRLTQPDDGTNSASARQKVRAALEKALPAEVPSYQHPSPRNN